MLNSVNVAANHTWPRRQVALYSTALFIFIFIFLYYIRTIASFLVMLNGNRLSLHYGPWIRVLYGRLRLTQPYLST
jgi:hypothetical protein